MFNVELYLYIIETHKIKRSMNLHKYGNNSNLHTLQIFDVPFNVSIISTLQILQDYKQI